MNGENDNRDENKKKKKKRTNDDFNPFESNPFENMNDEDKEKFNNQMKNIFGQFGNMFADQMKNMDFSEMMNNFMKQMDPDQMANMMKTFNRDFQNQMRNQMKQDGKSPKGPFVFGMNMKIGPDGMPRFEPVGNINKKKTSEEQDFSQEIKSREPLTDIIEEDDEIIVVAEMPGCTKEKIELRATDKSITIIGNSEEGISKFEVTLDLPAKINPDHAKANYKNGILEIKLKKKKHRLFGKKIKIN